MAKKAQASKEGSGGSCEAAIAKALKLYGVRAVENIALHQLPDNSSKARVLGRKLMEHGDARAYAIGKELLEIGKGQQDGPY